MTKRRKILLAIAAVFVGIVAGIILVLLNQEDYISEETARAVITERYGDGITTIETQEDEQFFSIMLEQDQTSHRITLDREDSSVQDIETLENTKDETTEHTSNANEETEEEDTETLTLEEAEATAVEEVGGETVYSTVSEEENTEYYVLQQIDEDEEGALVSINGISGEVSKVIWLEIEDDHEEIEQLVHDAAEYADLYEQRYIEFDDDYFED